MSEMVASRCRQILELMENDKKENTEGEVNQLMSVLRRIDELLYKYGNCKIVVENMQKLRNLAHNIEDFLETWACMEDPQCPAKKFFTNLFTLLALTAKISVGENPIIWLQDTFSDDALESENLGIGEGRMLKDQESLMDAYGGEEHFVDIKEHLKQLKTLVAQKKEHRVVTICGAKGLGKTTLARRVYVHPEVRDHFEAFAWVSLWQENQISSHLKSMLHQLGAEEEEQQKGTEEKEQGTEKKEECAQEKEQGPEEKQKEGEEEPEKGTVEEKGGADLERRIRRKKGHGSGNPLLNMIKQRGTMKKSALERNEGSGEKKQVVEEKEEGAEGAEKQKEGEEEKIKGVEEQGNGTAEKKGGAELERRIRAKRGHVSGNPFLNMIKQRGTMKKSALERNEGSGEKKQGIEEHGEDAQVKKMDAGEKNGGVNEQQNNSEEKIVDELKKILGKKKCLVVIDNISEFQQLEIITSELKASDSMLLLTTEDETAVDEVKRYKLEPLSVDEGWQLLKEYAFPGNNAPDLGLVPRLGKEMVRKCDCLPWKISKLGRILSEMPSSEWPTVNNDVPGYLSMNSPTNSNEKNATNPNNYSEMLCFLYLAMFKKDDDIDPEDLSFLWMAEGMVSPQQQGGSTAMDVTENYLQALDSRGLLSMKMDEFSANRRLFPHSLENHKRELSLVLGQKKEFQFHLKVADFSGGKEPRFDAYILDEGTRRLAIHFDKLSSSPEKQVLKATRDLRSLLFLNSDREYASLPVTVSKFEDFTLLRVLHFLRCKFEDRKLPDGIWELTNLWYFGLSYCEVDELPPDIKNFKNLHVLNVRSYDDATAMTIPNDISKLVRLKHLRLPHNSYKKSGKLKLDGLTDLETLVGFDVDKHDLGSLSESIKFRYLETRASSNASLLSIINKVSKFVKSDDGGRIRTNLLIEHKCDFTSTEGLTILEEVLMRPNLDALTFSMVHIHEFPNCETYASPDITQIKLIGCKLNEDPMEALGKFPNLRKLCLGYGAFVGREMAIRGEGLPKLEILEFRCLPNLVEWSVDKGALKKLSTLVIKQCPMLKKIPKELASVPKLDTDISHKEPNPGRIPRWRMRNARVKVIKAKE